MEGEKKFEEKTEACVSSSNSVSACLLYYSLGIKGPAGVLIYSSSLVVSFETYRICDILKVSLQSCHFSVFIICLKLVCFMFLTQQTIILANFKNHNTHMVHFKQGPCRAKNTASLMTVITFICMAQCQALAEIKRYIRHGDGSSREIKGVDSCCHAFT